MFRKSVFFLVLLSFFYSQGRYDVTLLSHAAGTYRVLAVGIASALHKVSHSDVLI